MAGVLERAGLSLVDGFRWGELMLRLQRDLQSRRGRWFSLFWGTKGLPTRIYFDQLAEGVTALMETIQTWQPDVLVCDLLLPLAPIAAEACRIPYASLCPVALPLPDSTLPPYGFGLLPRGQRDWRWPLAALVHGCLLHSVDLAVNRVRRHLGLPRVRGAFFAPSPYLFLAFTTEALEYPRRDLPPQVYYVGPSISQRRGDTEVPFPWHWLQGGPTVYAALGTINTGQVDIYTRLIEASRDQPWQLVLSVGTQQSLEPWRDLPANVLVRPYTPQPGLLRRVQAAICHGGINTVTEALAAGVPLAVVPFGADQPENAQRVVEAGAGVRLKPRRVGIQEWRETMRRLLEEPHFRENARRIADDFARCDGPRTSASLLCRLAQERVPQLRGAGASPTVYATHGVPEGD